MPTAKLLLPNRTAADYLAIFQGLLKARPERAQAAREAVAWAKSALRKNDRVVWYLRWHKLAEYRALAESGAPGAEEAEERELKAYAAKAGMAVPADEVPSLEYLAGIRDRLKHLFSIPAPEIEAYQPGYAFPQDAMAALSRLERAHQENAKSVVRPHPGDKAVVDCGGGWAWWLLDRAYCPEESRAMGHCGNGGSQDDQERILSLRKEKGGGGWEPHLTFILDGRGMLGEMKGRNNDKPTPKYHPYIVRLLKDPIVKGIKGGGYLPGHNFSLDDLPEEEREALVEEKPALMTLGDYYRRFGADASFVARAEASAEAQGTKIVWVPELGKFEAGRWKGLEALVEDEGDDKAKYIVKTLFGGDYVDFASGLPRKEQAERVLEDLPKIEVEMVGRELVAGHERETREWMEENGYDPDEYDFDVSDAHDIASLADEVGDDLIYALSNAYETGARYGTESEMSEALLSAARASKFVAEDPDSPWDSVWFRTLNPKAVVLVLDDPDDSLDSWLDDDDEYRIEVSEPSYGWDGYDEKAAAEAFRDEYDPRKRYAEAFGEGAAEELEESYRERERNRRAWLAVAGKVVAEARKLPPDRRKEFEDAERRFRAGDREDLIRLADQVLPGAFASALKSERDAERKRDAEREREREASDADADAD